MTASRIKPGLTFINAVINTNEKKKMIYFYAILNAIVRRKKTTYQNDNGWDMTFFFS